MEETNKSPDGKSVSSSEMGHRDQPGARMSRRSSKSCHKPPSTTLLSFQGKAGRRSFTGMVASGLSASGDHQRRAVCAICGTGFRSMKALYGHMRMHPERGWRGMRPLPSNCSSTVVSNQTGIGSESTMTRRPCTPISSWPVTGKRGRPEATLTAPSSTSNSISSSQPSTQLELYVVADSGSADNSLPEPESDGDYYKRKKWAQSKICIKSLPWRRPLGGHRMKRKKVKRTCGQSGNTQDRHLPPPDANSRSQHDVAGYTDDDRWHVCEICKARFPSGQALGGHKRLHRKRPVTPPSESSRVSQTKQLKIDLNKLPRAEEEVEESSGVDLSLHL
ncbi:hypothetical protein SAY87_031610 [Trapa incisa]|uniref:C2H2-type domain-containing protein n=1 Tax=Trapa incisa TaxID=236973 RepID=A0AAN7QNC8_9MYRT|nr:hypothetical protein SAY87_031610 [Trapa incisa]